MMTITILSLIIAIISYAHGLVERLIEKEACTFLGETSC